MLHITTKLPIIDFKMYHISGQKEILHHDCRFFCLLYGSIKFNSKEIESGSREHTLSHGDILYIPAETSYTLDSKEPSLILYICLHPYFLLDTLGFQYKNIRTIYLDDIVDIKNSLNTYIANLVMACLGKKDNSQCDIYAKAYELLYYVSIHCIEVPPQSKEGKADKKLTGLRQFIGSHYMQSVSLSDAAAALSFTPQYLSSFLKKHLDVTFQEYLNRFRLEAAGLLLRYSQEPLSKISSLCGFPNQSSYLKSFQKVNGISAETYDSNYREQNEEEDHSMGIPITNDALIMDYIFNYMNCAPITTSLGENVKLQEEQVNIRHRTQLHPNWNFLINLGTATAFEKPTFRNHLTMMQQELNFQYGRCTEIFSLANIYRMNNGNDISNGNNITMEKTYDFSQIFGVIDFMKSIHLKPFFDIDNKPFQLYKDIGDLTEDYITYLSTVQYDAYLFEILPEFIKACITRYGFDEFSTWKFELWRRYNVNMTSLEPPDEFCRRFQKVAHIIKSLAPRAILGGPGFNGFLDTDMFQQIIAAFCGATYQPDFISAYCFPYTAKTFSDNHTPTGFGAAQSPNDMVSKISAWKEVLKSQGFGHLPFYITEYSSHISVENYINDSTYPAVYIFQQCIQNYGKVDGLGYWLATDISLDYGNPSSPLFGGNGIITKNGIRKSGYYAHDFLNRLGDQLIQKGKHYIVTATKNGTIQVLVYYFSNLKPSFAKSPLNQELLHYPYSAFEEVPPLHFHMELTHIPDGTYSIKETSLDLNHGNILSTWGELNHFKNIGSEDIVYMKHKSVPSVQIQLEEINHVYQLHTILNHNEAKLFTLHLYY